MESPEYAAHTISSYTITHNTLYGEYVEEERYDLMNVIAVRLALNEHLEGGGAVWQRLLNVSQWMKKLEQSIIKNIILTSLEEK